MLPKTTFTATRTMSDGTFNTWQTKALELKARLICVPCNNHWGSDLEGCAKEACSDLILKPTTRILSPKNCKAIADFAFKTSVLADCMDRAETPSFFSRAQRRNFAANRTIPPGVSVWLAKRGTKYFKATLNSAYGSAAKTKPRFQFEIYTCTFCIGLLVVQLLATRWADQVMRTRVPPPRINQPDALSADVIRIFPDDKAIQWPPASLLGDDLVDWFWQRFLKVNVPDWWLPD